MDRRTRGVAQEERDWESKAAVCRIGEGRSVKQQWQVRSVFPKANMGEVRGTAANGK